jgi:hypothetical protein
LVALTLGPLKLLFLNKIFARCMGNFSKHGNNFSNTRRNWRTRRLVKIATC